MRPIKTMPKQLIIEVPDWIDEKKLKDFIDRYVEYNLPNGVTREEYVEFAKINVDDIVEFSFDEELRKLDELRRKAKERCQF